MKKQVKLKGPEGFKRKGKQKQEKKEYLEGDCLFKEAV
jgi:hypothetical protein